MSVRYVHVKWAQTGADDMVPEKSAPLLQQAGDLKIIDPTPGPYRRFKPRVPLGTSARPKRTKKATPRAAANPAPVGASQPEEAIE